MAASVAIECKIEMMRKGGIAPCQWDLGAFPRGVGHLLEEEGWGQVGVVQGMLESTTEFGLRSQYRLESRKKFVEQDSSRGSAALILRKCVLTLKQHCQVDPVLHEATRN